MFQAKADQGPVLIESTSNQVDQFGGYTGMNPRQFVEYVNQIAEVMDFPSEKIILGGDHLGPNVWQNEPADKAMAKARDLICAYIEAGYTKIHLDTSMRCADDDGDIGMPFDDEIVAERAAELCRVAEENYSKKTAGSPAPVYIIGTEVPIPGGAQEAESEVVPTSPEDAERTIAVTRQAFIEKTLQSAWERVIGVVVQPGVEFGDVQVFDYNRQKAKPLSELIEKYQTIVYEAHSTDYQRPKALKQMVEDHFAILKVGPWLTFALREAVFALAAMENEWLGNKSDVNLSGIVDTIENAMVENPKYWQKHYHGGDQELRYARRYSYSDRVRYYWPQPKIQKALKLLLENLSQHPVPLTLLSQYMPRQYHSVRAEKITNSPVEIIRDKIMEVTSCYAYACNP
jgi:D-tagatose-1,6-bisphosphate aldolase subunit GatZ/KbaZ